MRLYSLRTASQSLSSLAIGTITLLFVISSGSSTSIVQAAAASSSSRATSWICPAGTYKFTLNGIDCQICPPGTYTDKPDAFYCKPCLDTLYKYAGANAVEIVNGHQYCLYLGDDDDDSTTIDDNDTMEPTTAVTTSSPSSVPSEQPTLVPSSMPSSTPSTAPSAPPSLEKETNRPTAVTTSRPSTAPTTVPSSTPSSTPSASADNSVSSALELEAKNFGDSDTTQLNVWMAACIVIAGIVILGLVVGITVCCVRSSARRPTFNHGDPDHARIGKEKGVTGDVLAIQQTFSTDSGGTSSSQDSVSKHKQQTEIEFFQGKELSNGNWVDPESGMIQAIRLEWTPLWREDYGIGVKKE